MSRAHCVYAPRKFRRSLCDQLACLHGSMHLSTNSRKKNLSSRARWRLQPIPSIALEYERKFASSSWYERSSSVGFSFMHTRLKIRHDFNDIIVIVTKIIMQQEIIRELETHCLWCLSFSNSTRHSGSSSRNSLSRSVSKYSEPVYRYDHEDIITLAQ